MMRAKRRALVASSALLAAPAIGRARAANPNRGFA
jgi:hypothetical protein